MMFKLKIWVATKLFGFNKEDFISRKQYEAEKKLTSDLQKMPEGVYYGYTSTTVPDVPIIWKVDEKGNCNCPYHPKKEVKRTVKKQTKKRVG